MTEESVYTAAKKQGSKHLKSVQGKVVLELLSDFYRIVKLFECSVSSRDRGEKPKTYIQKRKIHIKIRYRQKVILMFLNAVKTF